MVSLQNIISNPQHHSLANSNDRKVENTSSSSEKLSLVFLSSFPTNAGSVAFRMSSWWAAMTATHRSSTMLLVSLWAKRMSQMLGMESSWKTLQKSVITHSIITIFTSTFNSPKAYATKGLVSSSFLVMLLLMASLVASLKAQNSQRTALLVMRLASAVKALSGIILTYIRCSSPVRRVHRSERVLEYSPHPAGRAQSTPGCWTVSHAALRRCGKCATQGRSLEYLAKWCQSTS